MKKKSLLVVGPRRHKSKHGLGRLESPFEASYLECPGDGKLEKPFYEELKEKCKEFDAVATYSADMNDSYSIDMNNQLINAINENCTGKKLYIRLWGTHWPCPEGWTEIKIPIRMVNLRSLAKKI